ncbi:MAG: preprotein translocase subunit YajC [Arenimonas sp.]|nr:preprotein translocase subunit YajC [Arenimonas sp.]MBP7917614.1 preprotein translocase subunit YajC [Arenimonas sp.]
MSLLDLIISPAAAQAAPAQQGSPISLLVMMVLFFAVFYFMAIRPQMKRAKEHRALLSGLSKGDEVLTNGGVAGRIEDLGESFVTVEIADGVKVKVQKNAISAVLPKGSLKSA